MYVCKYAGKYVRKYVRICRSVCTCTNVSLIICTHMYLHIQVHGIHIEQTDMYRCTLQGLVRVLNMHCGSGFT